MMFPMRLTAVVVDDMAPSVGVTRITGKGPRWRLHSCWNVYVCMDRKICHGYIRILHWVEFLGFRTKKKVARPHGSDIWSVAWCTSGSRGKRSWKLPVQHCGMSLLLMCCFRHYTVAIVSGSLPPPSITIKSNRRKIISLDNSFHTSEPNHIKNDRIYIYIYIYITCCSRRYLNMQYILSIVDSTRQRCLSAWIKYLSFSCYSSR